MPSTFVINGVNVHPINVLFNVRLLRLYVPIVLIAVTPIVIIKPIAGSYQQ